MARTPTSPKPTTSAGPAVFGLFAARTGYPPAFALTGVLVLAVFPLALRERTARQ